MEIYYDPDECPEELMDRAMAFDQRKGTATLSELAPIYGKSDLKKPLTAIEKLPTNGPRRGKGAKAA